MSRQKSAILYIIATLRVDKMSELENDNLASPSDNDSNSVDRDATQIVHTSTSGLAIAAFITAFLAPIVVPIVLGHMAKNQIRKSNGMKTGSGLATASLILGYLSLAGFVFLLATGFAFIHQFENNSSTDSGTSVTSSADYLDGYNRGNNYITLVNGNSSFSPEEDCSTLLQVIGYSHAYTPDDNLIWTQGCLDGIASYAQ